MIRLLCVLFTLVAATDEKGLAFLKQKEAEDGVMKRPERLALQGAQVRRWHAPPHQDLAMRMPLQGDVSTSS